MHFVFIRFQLKNLTGKHGHIKTLSHLNKIKQPENIPKNSQSNNLEKSISKNTRTRQIEFKIINFLVKHNLSINLV